VLEGQSKEFRNMQRYLLVTPTPKNRILRYLERLKFAAQRARKELAGKQQQDDILSVRPRTLVELKRRGCSGIG
jgi:hypothetical protein